MYFILFYFTISHSVFCLKLWDKVPSKMALMQAIPYLLIPQNRLQAFDCQCVTLCILLQILQIVQLADY